MPEQTLTVTLPVRRIAKIYVDGSTTPHFEVQELTDTTVVGAAKTLIWSSISKAYPYPTSALAMLGRITAKESLNSLSVQ